MEYPDYKVKKAEMHLNAECLSKTEALIMYLRGNYVIKSSYAGILNEGDYSNVMRVGKAFVRVTKTFSIQELRKLMT